MRYKINIQKFDDERVLIYDSLGLDPDTINAINNLALKEEIRDIYFATLDDGRVGIICKPMTWLTLMNWREGVYGKKFPTDLRSEFLKKCDEALHGEEEYQQYKEKLTEEEKILKSDLKDAVDKLNEEDKKYGITEERLENEKLWKKNNETH